MIPIRDRNPTRGFPIITLALIAANVAVFVFWQPSFGAESGEQTLFSFCHAEIPYESLETAAKTRTRSRSRLWIAPGMRRGKGSSVLIVY